MIRTEAELAAHIASDPWMMEALNHVAALGLPDWWIVAGFVRAKVWDVQHGYADRSPIGDVDVVFFDPSLEPDADQKIESRLKSAAPEYPWEVCNQAHMHHYNSDAPYQSTVDAFSRWAETVSAVGVRLVDGRVDIVAPCGLDDLFEMVIRLNPHPDAKADVFLRRLKEKGWVEQWPKVRIVDPG